MNVPRVERDIGIEVFLTTTPGIGGKIRSVPEDFIVVEESELPKPVEGGRYTIAIITTRNWETNHLIRELSRRLHISRRRISFGGTKDKRAKTTQAFCFSNVPKEKIESLDIKDVEIRDVYQADKPINIGDLQGNRFDIIIRDISREVSEKQIEDILGEIKEHGGFPNFFGIQRFGVVRPITHLVGKQLVLANFKEAVWIYLTWVDEKEEEAAKTARETLRETNDYKEALKLFPVSLRFERAMLNHLVAKPNDYIGALQTLPRNLLTMFISAYQSYLFNKILSRRILRGLPINQAVVGDIVIPIRRGKLCDEEIPVTERNLDKVNRQLLRGKGFVSGVLLGSESRLAKGEMGEIEQKIIEEEGIDPRDFIIPEIPYISSYGTRRIILAPINNLSYNLGEDDLNPDRLALHLSFSLLKGCYATSLLREIMKSTDVTMY
ncbi:MAG TPA: tRNA pseudouridine(13) synthase TruD [Thermoplasmatales archaeon]|nr:tRNA pseudouridine(13) synthase TruD [Thermoplasmatales archaeon]